MAYWFFNTDKAARSDVRTCDLWFEHGKAFSGGDWKKYAKPLGELQPSDHCFMYENDVGIVGVGRVIEKWDGECYTSKFVYLNDGFGEYCVRVDWYLDLRAAKDTVDPRAEFGYGPPARFLQRIIKDEESAAKLVSRLECQMEFTGPDEINTAAGLLEGGVSTVAVDVHERNPVARRQCIEHWGTTCVVCAFAFSGIDGPLGEGYIHVHHLEPLSAAKGAHSVDPVKHLRPVCPNCHAMIHKKRPPYSIEEMKGFITIRGTYDGSLRSTHPNPTSFTTPEKGANADA